MGVDICDEDGNIYKDPNDPMPRTIQIIKYADITTSNDTSTKESFDKPYKHLSDKLRKYDNCEQSQSPSSNDSLPDNDMLIM